MKTGILIHVYNIEDDNWEYVAWGEPAKDRLGSLPLLCRMLLTETPGNTIEQVVICSGPSRKNGLKEHEYTRKYVLDHLDELAAFPQLQKLLGDDPQKLEELRARVEQIILGEDLIRTSDEVAAAARLFQPTEINQVIQIACASHAPRCMQLQVQARAAGLIAAGQQWLVAASDVCFADTTPADTVIFEKPHLPYDPMIDFESTTPAVLGQYFSLLPEQKQAFLKTVEHFMSEY